MSLLSLMFLLEHWENIVLQIINVGLEYRYKELNYVLVLFCGVVESRVLFYCVNLILTIISFTEQHANSKSIYRNEIFVQIVCV